MDVPSLDIASDPGLQHQLEHSRTRRTAPPRRREQRVEVVAGGLFLAAALALAVATDGALQQPWAAIVLGLAYVVALSIAFEVGAGYTVPTVLVLVPMLYLLPPGVVPLCVVAAHLVSYLAKAALGRRRIAHIWAVFGQGWHSLGPALVFAMWSPGAASWDDLGILGAAFAAYVAFDAAASLSVDHFGCGEAVLPLLRTSLWVYFVDLLLLPIGLTFAIAADGHVAATAALAPLGALLATFAGERRRRIDHALELSHAYRGTAMLLGDVVEHDDIYTGAHSRDVVALALAVGRRLGLDAKRLHHLEFGALLHDVGKIAVPKAIINKPGPLDAEEWAVVKCHTVYGERMLASVGGVLEAVGFIVRCSHEAFDGSGYPDGLAGEAIPIESRICAAADAFSAMTTDRPYRRALSREVALDELRSNAGTQFDPRVVDALVAELTAPSAG
jgi:HD-GYP domain-containing protein (c-di-GMP phosphodiesterase class II)